MACIKVIPELVFLKPSLNQWQTKVFRGYLTYTNANLDKPLYVR